MTAKAPAKPKPPKASVDDLVQHYNARVDDYNAAVEALDEKKRPITGLQETFSSEKTLEKWARREKTTPRKLIIKLIRRQNLRLGKHIKKRAIELLLEHRVDAQGNPVKYNDKYSSGKAYQEILEILWKEFPESATSAACLRWYVVHMREEANDQGLAWPDLPTHRPRSPAARKKK